MATDNLSPTAGHTSFGAWIAGSRWPGPGIVICVSLAYYFNYYLHFINLVDEGLLVNGAMRLLDGQQPITDFWAYPPGRYALIAGAFKLLGTHLTSERYLLIALLVIRNVLIYLVARRLLPFSIAIATALTLVLIPGPWHKVFYSLPLFAHLLLLLYYIDKPSAYRAIYCGVVSGITLYLRQDLAVFSLIAAGFTIVSVQLIGLNNGITQILPDGLRRRLLYSAGHISAVLLTALVVIIPLIYYYASTSDYEILISRLGPDSVLSANVVYQKFQLTPIWRLPQLLMGKSGGWMNYRFLDSWFPWVFIVGTGLVVLVGLYTVWHWWKVRELDTGKTIKCATLLVWSILAISRLINLPNTGTCLITGQSMMIAFAVLLVALWAWARQSNPDAVSRSGLALPDWPTSVRWLITIPCATVLLFSWFCLLSLTVVPVARVSAGSISCRVESNTPLMLERAELILPESQAADLHNVVEQIRIRSHKDQPIIAYRQAMFYFLADRPNATSFDNIIPPVALPDVAESMADVVGRTNPPVLHVIDLSESWTARILERYPDYLRSALFTDYKPAYRYGDYVLLESSPGSDGWDQMKPLWVHHNKDKQAKAHQ